MADECKSKTQNNGNGNIECSNFPTHNFYYLFNYITTMILANLNYGLEVILSFHLALGCDIGGPKFNFHSTLTLLCGRFE